MSWRMHLYRWAYITIGTICTIGIGRGVNFWVNVALCTTLTILVDKGVEKEINKDKEE